MDSMISLASVLFILSMINERIANFIKLQFSDSKILFLTVGNLKDKKRGEEECDRDKRIILLNIVIGTIVCLLLRADLISIISDIDKPSTGIGWKNFDPGNVVHWLTLIPGCFLTGCFLSLGSKFWHDLLDLLLYTKDIKKQLADPSKSNSSNMNLDIQNEQETASLEDAADKFKLDVIKIEHVTTAGLNTETPVPFLEVYTSKDFMLPDSIPKKLFYLDQNNRRKSIDVKIVSDFDPKAHSDLWPSNNILNAHPYTGNRGSMGGKVYQDNTGEPYFISCYHVVKSPAHDWDFKANGNETVKEFVSDSICGEIVNAIRDSEVDVAIMKAKGDFKIRDGINGIGAPYATRDLVPGDKRFKTKVKMFGGISQRLSNGYVFDLNVPADIKYHKDHSEGTEYHRLFKLIFIKSIDSDPFSLPGDSGSIVVDEYNYIIGILVGGQGRLSFVIPINTILNRLKIKTHKS